MRITFGLLGALIGLLSLSMLHAQTLQPDGGDIRAGTLPLAWNSGGPRCMELPEWQVHEYNADLYILRQSGCTDYEQPFIFLLFGSERALLLDTGSRRGNIAPEIKLLVHRWLLRNHRTGIPLLLVHSHAHTDHTAGDAELQALNDPAIPITYVAPTVAANQKFYGIAHWPEEPGSVDLGHRVLDALAIPGHEASAVALYDRQTAILFTGDNVYPGRLFIQDLTEYEQSNRRMLNFTADKPVAHILGNHVGRTRTPYIGYTMGSIYQPDAHELQLSRGVLLEIEEGLLSMHGTPQRIYYRDFTLWPVSDPAVLKQMDATIEQTLKQQLEHMWDQNQH
jgi:glyoxylase-like metal-dependent hydrolase (beta-lactamase superfamily II)